MRTTRRFKQVYVTVTGAYLVGAAALAATGLWLLGIALFLMGGVMTGASRHMQVVEPRERSERAGAGSADADR